MSQLRAAPTVLTIDGARIDLQVDLWRDFQPISPPGGSGLHVSSRLPSTATKFVVTHIWVLAGDKVWDSTPTLIAGTTTWTTGEGPQWGPAVTVDVVAQVRGPNGTLGFVRAADQLIRRTT